MELKKHLSDLQKTKTINTQFQNKLGEITIWLNSLPSYEHMNNEQINSFILSIQNFLCHNYYTEYIKIKSNENSTYDNCMNLILIILAKLSKANPLYIEYMFNAFINHLNEHLECFNYVISFYRLYITCPQLKQVGKTIGIYTYLFEIYKKIYATNVQIEPQYKLKDMRSIVKSKIIKNLNMSYDKKFLFENYLQLTDRPNNNNNNNQGITNINSNNSNGDFYPHSGTFQTDFSLLHTKKPSNSNINNQSTNNIMVSSQSSNITVSNLQSGFNSHQSKGNLLSRTERKTNNTRLSGDLNQNTAEISISSKDQSKGGIKTKVPLLKFPMDKSLPQHRYSIIRSSHRAEFSKSGDGGSTTATKNNLTNKLTWKNAEGSSLTRNYTNDVLLLEPKEKLRSLAMQLGESCIATGLAALINQKRDLELGKLKKNNSNNCFSNGVSCSSSQKSPKMNKYIQKLKSNNSNCNINFNNINEDMSYDLASNNNNENKGGNNLSKYDSKRSSKNFCNKSDNCLIENSNNIINSTNNYNGKDKSSYSIQSTQSQNYKNFIKIREILANFILSALKEYSFEDYNYLNLNVSTIYAYLLLPSIESSRLKNERKNIEMIEHVNFSYGELINYISNGNLIYQPEKINANIIHKIETTKNNNITTQAPTKNIFESFLSITFEEDNNCPLTLKNEYFSLYDLLQLYSTNIENELKRQIYLKNLQLPIQLLSNGIHFSKLSNIFIENIRKHIDPFLDIIKNKICFLLRSCDISNFYSYNASTNINTEMYENDDYIMQVLKQQLDILNDYIQYSKSRVLSIHILIHLSDVFLILKKCFIQILSKLSNTFDSSNMNNNEITERYDIKLPEKLLEAFCSFLGVITSLISRAKLYSEFKFLNETFISCSSWLSVCKFIFEYFLISNLNKENTFINMKLDKSASNTQRVSNNTNYNSKNNLSQILKDGSNIKFNDNLFENYKNRVRQSLVMIYYFYNCNLFYQNNILVLEKHSNNPNVQNFIEDIKYWQNSIKDYLVIINYFLNSKTGIVYDIFINTTGGIFVFSKIKLSVIFSHFNFINALLYLQENTLNFSTKYSSLVNEMTSLDLIRLHYISFIKLYNKNIIFNPNLTEVSTIIANCEKIQKQKTIKAFVKDINNDQNLLNIIIYLCKMHLRCLFALSKNRNTDVTNKFFQLKIVDYMTKEIELEHEAAEKIYKLNQYHNNTNNIAKNETTAQNAIPKINLNINFSKGSDLQEEENKKNVIIEKLEIEKKDSKNNEEDDFDEEFNEESDFEDDEFDDIPLVEPAQKTANYEDKIPKLNMIPTTFGDVSESNMNMKPIFIPPPIQKKKEEKPKKEESKQEEPKKEGEKPKIKLKLNLNLCKSTKNDKLKEELKLKENEQTNKKDENNTKKEENDTKQVQLPKLNILQPKTPENVEIDISKETNQNAIKPTNPEENSILASKIQVEIENHLKQKYNLFYQKALSEGLTEHDLNNVNQFYLKERNSRLLYQDAELQVLIISLIFSLIITPSRGTLDELYCSLFPYESNKLNILYIIHHHLRREENEHILPLLLKYISQLTPYGAGQRLLKLVSKKFFDISLYTNWEKIAGGQYGTVYQCNTSLKEPSIVAIKKIELEQNIFSPCHLFDIFTEITALETFRLENCVTQLFDYGCDEENYYIVMKRYPISLKSWRIKQTAPLSEMLPTYLSIFKDILEAVKIIHGMNTTHYDLKCDNIVLDYLPNGKDIGATSEDDKCIRVADFGECRIFLNENDEYCTRSRGTDVIKSPEMLRYCQIKADDDNYDRRRKAGTTRSSDIWSLGCLFYELLTGNFLFEEIQDNYMGFLCKIEKMPVIDLISKEQIALLDNNRYLTDFLIYLLDKNQSFRPNIDTAIERFEHVYALLVGGAGTLLHKNSVDNLEFASKRYNENYFEMCIDNCENMINNIDNIWNNEYSKEELFTGIKSIPEIFVLTSDIYCAQYDYIENSKNSSFITNKLLSLGITHIISWTKTRNRDINEKFYYLNLIDTYDANNTINMKSPSPFSFLFKTIDFFRHCMTYKGKILFIDDYLYTNIPNKPNFLIRSLILIIFSYLLNQNAYDTWTYLNSKLLFFNIPINSYLPQISNWVMNQNSIFHYLSAFPIYRCFCGGCQLILKRNFTSKTVKKCNCQRGHSSQQYSECPSNGCNEYINNIKKFYNISYDTLNWIPVTIDDFFIGINDSTGYSQNYKKIISNSRGFEENLGQDSINDKYSMKASGRKNMWTVYKCKICHCWLFGECMDKIQILGNNEYSYSKKMEQRKKMVKSYQLKELTIEKMI